MKKQVTILMTAAVLFLFAQSAAYAQKSSEAEKKKQENIKIIEEIEEANKEKARAEELYKLQMIDASTRRAEVQAIDESLQFFENRGSGYAVAYPDGYFGLSSRSMNSETLEYEKQLRNLLLPRNFLLK